LREYPSTQGSVYFSSKTFDKNPNGWNDSLRNHYYHNPAIIPPMPWLNNATITQPAIEKMGNNLFKVTNKSEGKIRAFGVLTLTQNTEIKFALAQLVQLIIADKTTLIDLSKVPDTKDRRVFVVAVDQYNNVSQLKEIK
ncbi:MAG: hypothetical protein RLZZ28_100, partial [Bacteroidota bacterium]